MTTTSMIKAVKWFATGLLTGAFLLMTFGAVATLDEIGRLPFYRTLPVCALLVDFTALFLLFRSSSRTGVFDQVRVRLPFLRFRPLSIFNQRDYGIQRGHGVLGRA